VTVIQKKARNPIAHLTPDDIEQIGVELDAIRQSVIDTRGADDAAYIRRVISGQRTLELGSRAVLLASFFPPAWILGTAGLAVAKIVENMEIGHNVMHGQWDWMRDDKIHSTTWEWDNASPSDMWKHTQCADTFPKASRPTRKNRSTAKPAASTPRTEGRRFRLGHRSVRPEVRPSMRSRVDARVPAGQVQRR